MRGGGAKGPETRSEGGRAAWKRIETERDIMRDSDGFPALVVQPSESSPC